MIAGLGKVSLGDPGPPACPVLPSHRPAAAAALRAARGAPTPGGSLGHQRGASRVPGDGTRFRARSPEIPTLYTLARVQGTKGRATDQRVPTPLRFG